MASSEIEAPSQGPEQAGDAGHEHSGHDHGGASLNRLAVSATTHCLTGCWRRRGDRNGHRDRPRLGHRRPDRPRRRACLGYTLTSIPLFRAGLTFSAALPIILATDTVSIAIMETIDNLVVLLVPGAMHAGLANPLLWGSIALGFAVAFPFAWWANRYLLARGKGHDLVHQYHHH